MKSLMLAVLVFFTSYSAFASSILVGASNKSLNYEADLNNSSFNAESNVQVANFKVSLMKQDKSGYSVGLDTNFNDSSSSISGLNADIYEDVNYYKFYVSHDVASSIGQFNLVGFYEKINFGEQIDLSTKGIELYSNYTWRIDDLAGGIYVSGKLSWMDTESFIPNVKYQYKGFAPGLTLGTYAQYYFGSVALRAFADYSMQRIMAADKLTSSDVSFVDYIDKDEVSIGLALVYEFGI